MISKFPPPAVLVVPVAIIFPSGCSAPALAEPLPPPAPIVPTTPNVPKVLSSKPAKFIACV